MNKIPVNISERILTVGPEYHNHRGGIGAVLEIYSKYFEVFNFLASYKVGSDIFKINYFIWFLFRFITKLIVDRKIKIIHIHGASYGSFYRHVVCFFIGKYIFRKKVIYHIHGAEYHLFFTGSNKLTKKLIGFFVNNADYVICLSQVWEDFYTSNFNVKKIQIVPNIIDYPKQNENIKDNKSITFLFLGLVGYRKGVFDLIKIISENKSRYIGEIKLIIGGNGEVEKLKKIIKDDNLEEIVEFVGWISNEQKTNLLQKADIYILPSYNEGLPISILEAMSYGKAIISTNVGGIPEIVIPGKNGMLVEPGNLTEIKSAIDYFIEHPEMIKNYGNESQLLIENYYPKPVINCLSFIYNNI